jgi:HEXXH motif-containing protein
MVPAAFTIHILDLPTGGASVDLNRLFPDALSPADADVLTARIREHRMHRLGTLLSRLASGSSAPTDRADGALDAFVAGLGALCRDSGSAATELVDQWQTSFFASRVVHHCTPLSLAADRLTPSLLTARLPDGSSPLAGTSFATCTDAVGAVHVPAAQARIRLRGMADPFTALTWNCAREAAVVRRTDGYAVELDLPLSRAVGAGQVDVLPYERVRAWDVPIIPDASRVLGLDQDGAAPLPKPSGHAFLSLAESLEGGAEIIEQVWPDVGGWVSALVPAFADLGAPQDVARRRSGSFGPGIPICLSRVVDARFHAEDVVHELQHQRFELFIPADEYFGTWSDTSAVFASPYRTDPRPLQGIHLGIHAFTAVNHFRLRYAASLGVTDALVGDMLDTHVRNVFALRTVLDHETLSDDARSYYDEIRVNLVEQERSMVDTAPRGAVLRALEQLRRHLEPLAASPRGLANTGVTCGLLAA